MTILVAPHRVPVVKAAVAARMQQLLALAVIEGEEAERIGQLEHWEPMDYQRFPEDDDWDVFALVGGRGIGKTSTMAYYTNAHALSPPCDTRIPGGHRMGIIAPTLGDAEDSCFRGPTGLCAYNPYVKIKHGIGGAYLVWPNGASAKLFSTQDAQQVDRLRAGGNRCFPSGTLVETESGPECIERIKPGDRVWTRHGLRPVQWAGTTGVRELWRLETTAGRLVFATPDHPVMTQRGWVVMNGLRNTDNIYAWSQASLSGMGTATHVQGSGTLLVDGQPGRVESRAHTSASSAELHSSLWYRPVSALQAAGSDSMAEPRQAEPTWTRRVLYAARRFVHGQQRRPQLALDAVRQCSPTGLVAPVYDLTIADRHEFFANGILVHNCWDWWEEFAAWPKLKEAYDQAMLGLRLGDHPRAGMSSTPRPRRKFIELLADPKTHVAKTSDGRTPTTDDNPHLAKARRERYYSLYAGTDLERQELQGEVLIQRKGALWTRGWIDDNRVASISDLVRVAVGVDPSGGDEQGNDEQGIIVAGCGPGPFTPPVQQGERSNGRTHDATDELPHGYVLADYSCKLDPDGWGGRVVQACLDYGADVVVAEKNFGGDMVKFVVEQAAKARGVWVNVQVVTASRGKRARAEPIAALYAQHRVHHVQPDSTPDDPAPAETHLQDLEDQQCTWVPSEPGQTSPDRMDSVVWALSELLIAPSGGKANVWSAR